MLRLSFLLALIFFSSCFSARKITAGDYSSCETISRTPATDTLLHYSKIRIEVLDKYTGEDLPFCSLVLHSKKGKTTLRGETAFDGEGTLENIPPGTYTLEIECLGYQPVKIKILKLTNDSLRLKSRLAVLPGNLIRE